MRTYRVTTEPAREPISLCDLKSSLRLTTTEFDGELARLLTSARRRVEYEAQRRLITQTVVMDLDDFPSGTEIEIREAPVQSVSSITYYDTDGSQQTLSSASYAVDVATTPPRIWLKDGYNWPGVDCDRPNAVSVTYVAGYGANTGDVPAEAKCAIIEDVKASWGDCEGNQSKYRALVDRLAWTAYHKVEA